jgi:hypothetical protein
LNEVENSFAPPSPPWDDDDDVSMMMASQSFKSFCASSGINDDDLSSDESTKMSNMVDEFLSYSPDSLRLDSDTDEAINSFLLEAAVAVVNPSSTLSPPEMPSIKMEGIEEGNQNITTLELVEAMSIKSENSLGEFDTDVSTSCDDKRYTQDVQEDPHENRPKFNQGKKKDPSWKHVVLTVDDDNNIIEDNVAESEEIENEDALNQAKLNVRKGKLCGIIKRQKLKKRLTDDNVEEHLNCQNQTVERPKLPTHDVCSSHCSVCKLVFTSETQLAEHRLAYAQRIACCHCCKTFATMSKLRVHHRKHSKEKPFQVN